MYSFLYHFSTSRHSAGRASVSWPSTGHMFALSSLLYSSPTNWVFICAEFGTNTTCRLMQDSWHIMSWLSCRFSVTLRPAAQSLSRCRVSCLIKMPHFTAPPPNRPSLCSICGMAPPVNHTVTSHTQHLWSVSARAGFNLNPEQS